MKIRSEVPADRQGIRKLTISAFADPDSGREPGEAALLSELYACDGYLPEYSVVAEINGHLVGHAIATRGWLDGDIPLLGLGPVSVEPGHQKQGVGTALLAEIRNRAAKHGERAIVLLGSPEYYGRFGYGPAMAAGIIPSDPSWGDYFMVLNLSAMQLPKGNFRYAEPFGV
ncbi:N-acetyltransferase [Paeniglutamicibacter psychrophenolicus]|uniref:N-acetyltransferase YhbS n=1 Tax=Paeniglutamicibacter psychrophenolicus TaxID=257454 RepID=A0ABS4WEL4_9MICC|nr:N-acetyltransferase [Paeniglutamicibacter psychrophenolicus]MBP2374363.1 putative N-acetyltransferase YhbS [Paeniglutamicibacter psychrophenolicus]